MGEQSAADYVLMPVQLSYNVGRWLGGEALKRTLRISRSAGEVAMRAVDRDRLSQHLQANHQANEMNGIVRDVGESYGKPGKDGALWHCAHRVLKDVISHAETVEKDPRDVRRQFVSVLTEYGMPTAHIEALTETLDGALSDPEQIASLEASYRVESYDKPPIV